MKGIVVTAYKDRSTSKTINLSVFITGKFTKTEIVFEMTELHDMMKILDNPEEYYDDYNDFTYTPDDGLTLMKTNKKSGLQLYDYVSLGNKKNSIRFLKEVQKSLVNIE